MKAFFFQCLGLGQNWDPDAPHPYSYTVIHPAPHGKSNAWVTCPTITTRKSIFFSFLTFLHVFTTNVHTRYILSKQTSSCSREKEAILESFIKINLLLMENASIRIKNMHTVSRLEPGREMYHCLVYSFVSFFSSNTWMEKG